MRIRSRVAAGLALALLGSGCGGVRYDQAIAVLIDVSGTYAAERSETVKVIKRNILPELVPGDTLLVIRIDSESYDQENVEALLTLDKRPSHANAQKLSVARKLDAFATRSLSSRHTDIPGAIMLASEYLKEIGAGSSAILIFSDMQEDLPKGAARKLASGELDDIHVMAMNVKRLKRDTADPAVFRQRLASWEERLTGAGALDWRALMDTAKLPDYLRGIRS